MMHYFVNSWAEIDSLVRKLFAEIDASVEIIKFGNRTYSCWYRQKSFTLQEQSNCSWTILY